MELRQLEYFLMVSEVNSFTRAAERLYVSQPAVTNAIRSLEEELGIQLFDRGQKQALLTTEGKIFFSHVEKVMCGVSKTIAEITELKNLNSGILTLGLTPLAGMAPIPGLLKEFNCSYPNIKLSFVEDNVASIEKALLADKLDMAIVFAREGNVPLTYTPLAVSELFVCCAKAHPYHRKNSIALSELVSEPLILFKQECFFRQMIIAHFEEINTLPQIAFETDHVQTLKGLVASNAGLSILPRDLCESDQNFSVIPLENPMFIKTALACKQGKHLSHAAQALMDLFISNHSMTHERNF